MERLTGSAGQVVSQSTGGILTALGWLFSTAGVLLVSAGVFYAAMGWRYGTVVAIWAAQWGLPLFGVGIGLSRFGRRGTGVIAAAAGLVAGALIVLGKVSHEYDSYSLTLAIDGAAVLIGAASALSRRYLGPSGGGPRRGLA